MRTVTLAFGAVAFATGLWASTLLSTSATAQEGNAGAPDQAAQMAEMMALYDKYTSPSEMHEALGAFVGDWDVEIEMPGMPGAAKTTGKATVEWAFGGRLIHETTSGEMMGQPFTGVGYMGYDNFKHKYTSSWFGDQATATYHSEGLRTPDGKTYYFFGLMDEYLTGEHDKTVKYVRRWIDDDTWVYEVHDPYIAAMGGDTLVIRMQYTRAQ
jgi:hypothetical protein